MTEAKKRLYTVTVEFQYAVLARDTFDALDCASDALNDVFIRDYAHATPTVYLPQGNGPRTPQVRRPDDYEDSALVYGADEDITLAEAIAREVTEFEADIARDEFNKKQGNLFPAKEGDVK